MEINLKNDWSAILVDELQADYFIKLIGFLDEAYAEQTIYPKAEHIFHAFNLVDFSQVKVVLLGQDPYHGKGQAHGLCFSVPDGVKLPPSLKNIFKEIRTDLGFDIVESGNLENWARQGVLLLNATLTVEAKNAGSHQKKGWEMFTDAVIKTISDQKENVVFLLWGNFARSKKKLIDNTKHYILEAAHPSPLSAYNGFFGCEHFSKTNNFLLNKGIEPINWKTTNNTLWD